MNRIRWEAAGVLMATAFCAHAQNAMLRIACDENAAGAEIQVNGRFMGDCPLDMAVAPGSVRIRATRKIDARREQVFEQEFRIGPGVAKRIDVLLSTPQLNAEARRQAQEQADKEEDRIWQAANSGSKRYLWTGYLQKYPSGRYAALARRELDALPPRPRPVLPFRIPEDVWRVIEASEAYDAAPDPVAFSSSYLITESDANLLVRTEGGDEITPLGSGYFKRVHRHTRTSTTPSVKLPPSSINFDSTTYSALGGLLPLFQTHAVQTTTLTRIETLSGSLFPPRAGAEQHVRFFSSGVRTDMRCRMLDKIPASSVKQELVGNAWEIRCELSTELASGGDYVTKRTFHYLEELRMTTDQIGIVRLVGPLSMAGREIAFDLPSAGRQTHANGGKEIHVERFDRTTQP